MNCKQIKSSFYDFADGTLNRSMRSVIEGHLSGCAVCRQYYEKQCNLHQDVTNAVASELADLHFQPKNITAEPSSADYLKPHGSWIRQMAFAMPALLLLYIIIWPFLKPAPELIDDPDKSAYAEAYRYLEMYRADRSGASGFAMPVVVIIQPGAPARVIELDGTTDISAELK